MTILRKITQEAADKLDPTEPKKPQGLKTVQGLRVGEFILTKEPGGGVVVWKSGGEMMVTTETRFAQVLSKYWEEEF